MDSIPASYWSEEARVMPRQTETRKRVGTEELPMHCEWCGDEIDDRDVWDDGHEHYFDSEMCLGQYEGEGGQP